MAATNDIKPDELLKNPWVLGGIGVLAIAGLIWWRSATAPDTTLDTPTEEEQAEERANQFLEESGIQLPEGAERANLSPSETAGDATGVVTREEMDGQVTMSFIASIPEDPQNQYIGWLQNSQTGDVLRLGVLSARKGGYILEATQAQLDEGFDTAVISDDPGNASEPQNVVLEGRFPEEESQALPEDAMEGESDAEDTSETQEG